MPWRENKGVCQFKRNLYGCFGGCFARNLLWKSLMKYGLWPEINHRNLDGIYAEIKSLTKILDQNALEYLASWEDLIGDRLRLDI